MFARVMIAQVMPGKTDQMLKIYQSIISTTTSLKGFKGILTLTDRNTNKAIFISLWESKADMMAGESSGHVKEKIATIAAHNTFAMPPVTEHYDVNIYIPPDGMEPIIPNTSTATD